MESETTTTTTETDGSNMMDKLRELAPGEYAKVESETGTHGPFSIGDIETDVNPTEVRREARADRVVHLTHVTTGNPYLIIKWTDRNTPDLYIHEKSESRGDRFQRHRDVVDIDEYALPGSGSGDPDER